MKKIIQMRQTVKETVSKNFKSATIMFLLIMLVVYGFQIVFGPKNMVLGIIIAPMMLVLMSRDMTAHPVRHFLRQAFILCGMATAACFSMLVPAPVALFIHFTVAFFLLYTYTCDCGDHMYFQYILNYMLLIFMGPISVKQLPLRLLGMVTGAACLLLYQCVKGRGRMGTATRDVLLSLLEDTKNRINGLLSGDEPPKENVNLEKTLKTFTKAMEHRRKATLRLSDASMATMEIVISLEKINIELRSSDFVSTEEKKTLLREILVWMDGIHSFILGQRDDIPPVQMETMGNKSLEAEQFYQWANHLREAFINMLCPEKLRSFRKTSVPLWARLKIALNYSPVRLAYALRLSCLLAVGIVLVQNFHLEYGKWMLYTIASVSMPYADEVGDKAKKRFLATLIGGAAGLIAFSVIPSPTGKMAAMLASGYLSGYMTGYLRNFACATFGALGGAIFSLSATGFVPVGGMVLVRIGYIIVGIIIAIAFNCFVLPVNKKKATKNLAHKYIQITGAVSKNYQSNQPDLQLHYHLLLRMHRLEDKLRQNAEELQWQKVHSLVRRSQMKVWKARKASA